MWSKPGCTNRKSASAERCLRALGATLAMGIPVMRRSKHSRQGVFSHQGLRKASAADPVNTGLAGSTGMAGLGAIRGIPAHNHQLRPVRWDNLAHHLAKQGIFTAIRGVTLGHIEAKAHWHA